MLKKICPKCQNYHFLSGTFCSRSCANSRGARSAEFKERVSLKLKGKNYNTNESIRNGILSKGLIPNSDKPNTICVICNNDTQTKHRKTCSRECYLILNKKQTQLHPKCGGQKHTHRSKITNIAGEIFIAESSYEVKLSNIFNEIGEYWTRPNYFWYTDAKGNKRRYYPDFYLPKYNLYFDPKNDYLIKIDTDKIKRAENENNIKIIVLGNTDININTIRKLVGSEELESPTNAV